MKISAIQMNSGASKPDNIRQAEELIRKAVASDGAQLVALPEMFACLSGQKEILHESAEAIEGSPTVAAFSALAQELGIYLHIGSLIEEDAGRFYNTAVALDPGGHIIARYRKMHLFDITLPDGTEIFESKLVGRGEKVVTYAINDLTVGCSICYDLRFPDLYRKLSDLGSKVIMAPAAFTFQTGAAHWEILVRSRALETQCYVVAPAQVHSFDDGRHMTYGHAMIVDPWGQIVAQASNQVGWITAQYDEDWLQGVRMRLPTSQHHVLD